MTHTLPAGDWIPALAVILVEAKPGDIIQVDSISKVGFAARAMKRMDVSDVGVLLKEAKP